jgi:hypothetical protein
MKGSLPATPTDSVLSTWRGQRLEVKGKINGREIVWDTILGNRLKV